MAVKQTPKIRMIKKEYSRAEILESLAYELKPFVLTAIGLAGSIYFTQNAGNFSGANLCKYLSMTILGCSLFILYARAKDRGVIQ